MAEQKEDKLKRYNELFAEKEKAEAFDMLANEFYARNFGQMSKSDLETLMFNIYLNRILDVDEENTTAYSDYRLSKELGITSRRVSGLKEKKQLQYPRNLKWGDRFADISKNARYDNGKIKVQIPDINLYNEIKNAVEEVGGYVEVTSTPKLLQISPDYFFDLLAAASVEENRDQVREELRDTFRAVFREQQEDKQFLEEETYSEMVERIGNDAMINILSSTIEKVDQTGLLIGGVSKIAGNVIKKIESSNRKKKINSKQ